MVRVVKIQFSSHTQTQLHKISEAWQYFSKLSMSTRFFAELKMHKWIQKSGSCKYRGLSCPSAQFHSFTGIQHIPCFKMLHISEINTDSINLCILLISKQLSECLRDEIFPFSCLTPFNFSTFFTFFLYPLQMGESNERKKIKLFNYQWVSKNISKPFAQVKAIQLILIVCIFIYIYIYIYQRQNLKRIFF